MKKRHLLLIVPFMFSFGMLAHQAIFAFFTDAGSSSGNTFAASSQFPITSPITSAQPGDIVINEINWGGSTDEWIELRNMTSNPINLFGWVIENLGTGSGPGANIVIATSSSTIAASGFYLVSANPKNNSVMDVDPDFIKSNLSLVDGGEQLRLLTSTISGTLIDTANADPGAWFAGSNSTPKKSMARNSLPGDGTLSTSWHTSSSSANLDSGSTELATPRAQND